MSIRSWWRDLARPRPRYYDDWEWTKQPIVKGAKMKWTHFPLGKGGPMTWLEILLNQKDVKSINISLEKDKYGVAIDGRLEIGVRVMAGSHANPEYVQLASSELTHKLTAFGVRFSNASVKVVNALKAACVEYQRLCNVNTCPHCKEVIKGEATITSETRHALKEARDLIKDLQGYHHPFNLDGVVARVENAIRGLKEEGS